MAQPNPSSSFLSKTNGYVDGSIPPPSSTIIADNKTSPNPEFSSWQENDQRVLILLRSSLSEEAMAETLGLNTARDVWRALECAYSHDSVERMQNLRDSLRQLHKGTMSVSDYGRQFKSLCDQLTAIGQPVNDLDKTHWFLCGLGPSFETFSTAQRAVKPRPSFRDLLSQAEGHELFLKSMHGSTVPQAAFVGHQTRGPNNSSNRGSVDPALLRPDEMIMILNLYLVNSNHDQDQETNEYVLQSTDPIH
ncbi:hypothetical protein OSB04_012014 [Centaurea solstitialis]|uniref:Uncharacterized protein n=1 Tax=Centaurea solstitialis TaxID=347529 RepID=A0AA38TAK6_9ASTR|nr:hypothetical protein OSB04_012014 [Centaurea solstitialis]